MNILEISLITIFVISVIVWLYNWSQACLFLKEPNALSLFMWPSMFFSEKFIPEGEKYRKKALIFFYIQLFPVVIYMAIN